MAVHTTKKFDLSIIFGFWLNSRIQIYTILIIKKNSFALYVKKINLFDYFYIKYMTKICNRFEILQDRCGTVC